MTDFAEAARYAELRNAARIRDRPLLALPRIPSELELQARWFAGDFGKQFRSTTGDEIEVVQFGVWNREAGPDFTEAAVRINGTEPQRGSIEFDVADRNWEAHGHATNPAFDSTVLHVFVESGRDQFFTRTSANRNIPQVRVELSALDDLLSTSVPLARPGRCQAPLRDLPEPRVTSILDAAAQFRLRRKATRLQRIARDHGRDQALFQEIAAALGYKQNKLPFTLLAQRVPLQLLRDDVDDAAALLFGVAGFLEARDLNVFTSETRTYVRALWDRWWKRRGEFQRLILPPAVWKLSGARPLNHPQRRLGALAAVAREWPRLAHLLGHGSADAVRKFFAELHDPFWEFHYTLTAEPSAKPMALIGNTRTAEILANALYPHWLGRGDAVWSDYTQLRAQLTNRRIETAAARLFADDPRRFAFLKTVAHQQGLLQIYEDFCMQDNSDCAQCPFPEQMQKWR